MVIMKGDRENIMPTHQKYPHRRTIRLQNYDYHQAGCYFVTICTQDQKCMFGEIVKGEMYLNGAGSLAQSIWSTLPERFAHVELDQYMVMPNHLHGIMVLTGSPSMPKRDVDTVSCMQRVDYIRAMRPIWARNRAGSITSRR